MPGAHAASAGAVGSGALLATGPAQVVPAWHGIFEVVFHLPDEQVVSDSSDTYDVALRAELLFGDAASVALNSPEKKTP